jgi:pimeloyl-ACP methyl ester carboxylesterase
VPPDFEYETAARIGLLFWTYWPGRALPRFSRPVLVAPCKADAINPPKPTLRRARRCASAKLVELDCAHMEVVLEPHRSRVVDATLDFLAEAQCSGQVD